MSKKRKRAPSIVEQLKAGKTAEEIFNPLPDVTQMTIPEHMKLPTEREMLQALKDAPIPSFKDVFNEFTLPEQPK
jgi:hypothetical protein